MRLRYFPGIDEPHMPRTQKRSRFAYLFDLDEQPSEEPKRNKSKSASNDSSANSKRSDEYGRKSKKTRSIIKSTISFAKKGLKLFKSNHHRSRKSRSQDEQESHRWWHGHGRGGPWTSTEILQDRSNEYSPSGGELKRSKAIRLPHSTAHLKERRASLNQKLVKKE
ncbi:hypothetical protein AC579_9053 [Pseudocercospora musae]|uniref:Uncharacterized protein n=1 Tax=Pseudocercospora musae TaxID=113226 RepID=A0A139ISA6_9PEZI|nr:hypothetical protein AC579_9053 [Pseudocercospora musae]